jgi:hypothetical protein
MIKSANLYKKKSKCSSYRQMLFWRNNIEDGNCPSPGLFAAPELEYPEGLSLMSYVKPIKNILPHREVSLRWDAKIKKFDMKTKF